MTTISGTEKQVLALLANCSDHRRHRRDTALCWQFPTERDREHSDCRRDRDADDAGERDVNTEPEKGHAFHLFDNDEPTLGASGDALSTNLLELQIDGKNLCCVGIDGHIFAL